ncbi:MAG: DUF4838 domain-containing protein [Lachnospiraceae bacterium]
MINVPAVQHRVLSKSHPMAVCRQAIDGIDVENNAADGFALSGQAFADDLADWAKIAPHLYLWDYTTNFSNYLQPFPNWHVIGENLRLFRRLGVEGVLEQGNYAPGKASAFAPLRIYLLSRLLWNADADTRRADPHLCAGLLRPGGGARRAAMPVSDGKRRLPDPHGHL